MAFGDADRWVYLETAVFGSKVVVGATTSTGVLKLQWLEEQDASGMPFKTQRPTLQVARGTFTRPAVDATVTVDGTEYVYRGKVGASNDALGTDSGLETWVLSEVS